MAVKVIKAQKNVALTGTTDSPQGLLNVLRVAAYCRVSTDSEEQETSYDAQVTHYTAYISTHPGWTLAGIFADEGISGTQAAKRPEFNRMIEECEKGNIDLVITKSISRFARNTINCLKYIRQLKALSIPVIFEKESVNTMEASGELMITILASIAQQESASISQNVKMGIQFGFQQGRGRLNYSIFLGYKRGDKPGTYEIVPEEADVVRRIYREYLEGFSPYMIAEGLMDDHICTPAGGDKWYTSTVESILENEKYCGDLLMQKYYVEDFLTHKVVKNKGDKPQYFVEDDHEPIVPKAVFYQVQGERKRRGELLKDPTKLRFGKRLALNGQLVCGKCGRTLKRYVKPNAKLTDWRCRKRSMTKKTDEHESTGSKCDCRIVKEVDVQDAVIGAFNLLPEHRLEIEQMLKQLASDEISRIDGMLESLNTQQDTLEERLDQIVGETEDSAEVEFLKNQIAEIREKKSQLYSERADHANKDVQIRILLELLEQMEEPDEVIVKCGRKRKRTDGACNDYNDFFHRTRYVVPKGVIEDGRIVAFDNGFVIRYLDKVIVEDWGYEIRFKAGINVKIGDEAVAVAG